jgi:hypothetical protein
MFRIGTVNIDTSHAPSFAEILLKGDTARYTAIYNDGFRTDEEVSNFMERFGVKERYTDLAEMAKNVDIAFIQSCNWDRHIELSMPFIEAGVPVFIDKPLVGNLKDCKVLEQLAAEGKVILGTSAMRYTYERDSFFAGVAALQVGNRLGDVGSAIDDLVVRNGFSTVKRYIGHGIGHELHESPDVPNYGTPGRGTRLCAGMVLAIEPMVNIGGEAVRELKDGWTVKTADASLSAHYENTVALTGDGVINLTLIEPDF